MYLDRVKIHCENALWSERIQRVLHEEIGASWGFGLPIPWNTQREWLIVQFYEHSQRWAIHWATEEEFNECDAPMRTARELYHARPNKD
jgi:hypothetical protein